MWHRVLRDLGGNGPLYDNNCFIILYFVSGKVEQNESPVCFGYINQKRRRPATYPHQIPTPHPFLNKKTFFPFLYCFFFLHFKMEIPKKKDMVWICGWPSSSLVYVTKAYWTFVLFHFSWNKIKNNKTIIVVKGPLPPKSRRTRCHILTRFL